MPVTFWPLPSETLRGLAVTRVQSPTVVGAATW